MKNILYLSRKRGMMLRLSFLVIIVSFSFCPNRLYGLKITNGLEEKIRIMYVRENPDEYELSDFVDFPKDEVVVQSGVTIEVGNKVRSSKDELSEIRDASFQNLSIGVKYKGWAQIFEVVPIPQNVRKGLENNTIAVIFKIPENKTMRDDYYFNAKAPLNEFNVRFDPAVKLR